MQVGGTVEEALEKAAQDINGMVGYFEGSR